MWPIWNDTRLFEIDRLMNNENNLEKIHTKCFVYKVVMELLVNVFSVLSRYKIWPITIIILKSD